MTRRGPIAILFVLLFATGTAAEDAAAPPPPPPDEILLKDGSLIKGTIKTMADGALVIENPATGAVSIKFGDIETITSASNQTFVLKDGSSLVGKPAPSASGGMELRTESSGVIPIDFAQVTALNPPVKQAVTHKGNLSIGGRITDGNTRTKSAYGSADYEARSERNRLTLRGDWNYAQDGDELTARNASAGIKYDVFITKRLFAYAHAAFEGDRFQDLNLRSTAGAGLGLQILDNPRATWYEEAGVSYIDEDFDHSPDDNYPGARIAGKFDWKVILDRVSLFHLHAVYLGFEDQDDVLVDTQQGLRLMLAYGFFASAQVNYRWDNTPAPGTLRGDTEYLWQIGYAFEF